MRFVLGFSILLTISPLSGSDISQKEMMAVNTPPSLKIYVESLYENENWVECSGY